MDEPKVLSVEQVAHAVGLAEASLQAGANIDAKSWCSATLDLCHTIRKLRSEKPRITALSSRANGMERMIEFLPAWDERKNENGKNYGVHGAELRFVLKGEHGAYQFVIYTQWHLPHVQEEMDSRPVEIRFPYLSHKPTAADFGYHARTPQHEGDTPMFDSCGYLDGAPCYYDGSGLYAEKVFDRLVAEGQEAVWDELETAYKKRFGALE